MVDQLASRQENLQRIQAVQSSFGPSGKALAKPGRVLVGEGRLMKLCRRRPQPKVFFLFNDVLVYGSIVFHGRWHKSQQIIPLENIQLEDLEDGLSMSNQWLIRTPRKSFHVGAASPEEKQAWMKHISDCRAKQLQNRDCQPGSEFAVTWIPDRASAICMRCSEKFGVTQRRHHCRQCGFIVCNGCSKARVVLPHISSKPVRVCRLCQNGLRTQRNQDQRPQSLPNSQTDSPPMGHNNDWKSSSDEDATFAPEYELSSDEEEEPMDDHAPRNWVDSPIPSWSPYVYVNRDHQKLNQAQRTSTF